MRRSLQLQKQTLHPPRNPITLASNPLTRWSRRLPKWADLGGALTRVQVGLEGCHSAFNATNSVRTCLYFQTASPPTFLTAASWKAIEHVQVREAAHRESSAHKMHEDVFPNSRAVGHAEMEPGPSGCGGSGVACGSPFDGIALFGEEDYFSPRSHPPCDDGEAAAAAPNACPLVALENFADGAQSIMRTRLPTAATQKGGCIRLVVGHENWGVRRSLLRAKDGTTLAPLCDRTRTAALVGIPRSTPAPMADMVVYVPQYGTTSSLNVATSLGIALFYCYMDAACPEAREIYLAGSFSCPGEGGSPDDGASSHDALEELRRRLHEYQAVFSKALPAPATCGNGSASTSTDATSSGPTRSVGDAHVNTTPRVDQRPLHPAFYLRNSEEIQDQLRAYRQALLRYSGRPQAVDSSRQPNADASASSPSPASYFGLSVLYENEYDQRNFGGLIRSANAFLVDYIFYVGRRKINVVGAVGSYHYTPPVHLGALPDSPSIASTSDAMSDSASRDWATEMRARVKEAYGLNAPRNWWLLDCGHDFLYEATFDGQGEFQGCEVDAAASSPASLQAFRRLKANGQARSLCDSESSLREASDGGLVLLVPQEGRLPHPGLMGLCTGVLTVLPEGAHFCEHRGDAGDGRIRGGNGHRGLPSQVASGVALQRLSAVMHPRLAAL
ncbi:conserved hypothetical protein [Leishmania major strain Friedlin]|uniref:tRNA/rRNA methyltransferase SpoU type domain-containing protein n=1 Tax=Leishmania major TaxID=5664 RepID=Q4Q5A9_LEIMA|nr:conserved hypothetical protein [Leishmania major strain Friedlin]CAG9580275.1 hypothetical_protein_-_conserved [Leishmania major strain Friedlin]CAJ08693.1 conserved hypothetical protein [Leishmania major strain Friedlin]|eukprot:XP_001685489.1 conserved hypothetical protein [Leishmania major strain Friedlin]